MPLWFFAGYSVPPLGASNSAYHRPLAVKWAGQARVRKQKVNVNQGAVTISAGPRLRAAMIVAIAADVLQMVVFPLFVEGAISPADDLVDLGIAGVLSSLVGWHWEFAPSFLAKLVPGVDLVPLWTLAVANVYRKSKQAAVAANREGYPAGPAPRNL